MKLIDENGLKIFWNNIKKYYEVDLSNELDSKLDTIISNLDTSINNDDSNHTTTNTKLDAILTKLDNLNVGGGSEGGSADEPVDKILIPSVSHYPLQDYEYSHQEGSISLHTQFFADWLAPVSKDYYVISLEEWTRSSYPDEVSVHLLRKPTNDMATYAYFFDRINVVNETEIVQSSSNDISEVNLKTNGSLNDCIFLRIQAPRSSNSTEYYDYSFLLLRKEYINNLTKVELEQMGQMVVAIAITDSNDVYSEAGYGGWKPKYTAQNMTAVRPIFSNTPIYIGRGGYYTSRKSNRVYVTFDGYVLNMKDTPVVLINRSDYSGVHYGEDRV